MNFDQEKPEKWISLGIHAFILNTFRTEWTKIEKKEIAEETFGGSNLTTGL